MKMRRRGIAAGMLGIAAQALLLLLAPARATTLARLTLDELAGHADAVARVRCTSANAQWIGGAIWTVTRAEVVETLKGSPPAQIEIRLPGGRVGGLATAVDGAPRFRPGEEVFVFLERSPAGGYTVAGWVEGTFRISRDARTGAETVTQDSSAFAVFDPATRAFRPEGIRRMPLAAFRARTASAIARGKEPAR